MHKKRTNTHDGHFQPLSQRSGEDFRWNVTEQSLKKSKRPLPDQWKIALMKHA